MRVEIMNSLDLSRSALLLIDLQKDFLHPQGLFQRRGFYRLSDEERNNLLENAHRLLQALRDAGKPVVWIKTALRADHLDSALPWNIRLHKDLGPESQLLVEGSWGCEFLDELKPAEADVVVVKKGSSAFQFTYLDHVLSNLGVNACVAIGGPVAGALADSTRQGGALGYEMIVASDATFPANSPYLKTLWNRAELKSTTDVLAAVTAAQPAEAAKVKTALVVVDMQNDFVHPKGLKHRLGQSALTEAERRMIIENNRRLIDMIRQKGNPVLFVVTLHRRDALDSAPPPIGRRNKPIPSGADYLVEGSWGAQLAEGLEMREGDLLITKKGRSGFGFTPLHRVLRNLDVNHCIITGGAVHGCVEDTVREGAGLGYRLTLVPDALYRPNSPTIEVMNNYVEFKNTAEVLAELTA
jgi:nicotinamidase-related amidase